MISWREGKAGFVGASKYAVKGFFSYSYSLTSAPANPPVFAGPIPDILGSVGGTDIATDLSVYFTDVSSYSISPAIESGWSFDTGTGVLVVDSDWGVFGPYFITGTNASGFAISNMFRVIISVVATTGTSNTVISGGKVKSLSGSGKLKLVSGGKNKKL